jgi:uncharacterized protein YhbP (UPF0306 family)
MEEMETRVEKAIEMILENRYMDLATSADGNPWVAGLFFGVDPELNFYFVSYPGSRHAEHIRQNEDTAIAIWDSRVPPSDVDGLQISGRGKEIGEDELSRALEFLYRKRFSDPSMQEEYINDEESYIGDTNQRLYKISATDVYKCKVPTGEYDERIEVDKDQLKERLAEVEETTGLGNAHREYVQIPYDE